MTGGGFDQWVGGPEAFSPPPEAGGRGGSGWLNTYSGHRFFPLDPDPAEIDIRDIAHALAAAPRYAGMTTSPYSVAQHSVIVSRLVPAEHALWGLLHDASEAYLGDMPRPLKRLEVMAAYREAENRLMRAVATRFDLPWPEPPDVKRIDERMIPTEAAQLFSRRHPAWKDLAMPMDGVVIRCQRPQIAELSFLKRFEALTGAPVRRFRARPSRKE